MLLCWEDVARENHSEFIRLITLKDGWSDSGAIICEHTFVDDQSIEFVECSSGLWAALSLQCKAYYGQCVGIAYWTYLMFQVQQSFTASIFNLHTKYQSNSNQYIREDLNGSHNVQMMNGLWNIDSHRNWSTPSHVEVLRSRVYLFLRFHITTGEIPNPGYRVWISICTSVNHPNEYTMPPLWHHGEAHHRIVHLCMFLPYFKGYLQNDAARNRTIW